MMVGVAGWNRTRPQGVVCSSQLVSSDNYICYACKIITKRKYRSFCSNLRINPNQKLWVNQLIEGVGHLESGTRVVSDKCPREDDVSGSRGR